MAKDTVPVEITSILRVLAFSTATPLGASAVYTSPTIDAINYKSHANFGISDQAGSAVRQHSDDGVTWVSETATAVTANAMYTTGSVLYRRYFRIVYTNGATPQASFSLSVYLSPL